MFPKIVTHSGGAHMDDLISVCIVLAMNNDIKCVERRSAEPEEIAVQYGYWIRGCSRS
ncbi:MAG: hypothetical protein ACE5GV_16055 [Candidatus Scalindua sp.]